MQLVHVYEKWIIVTCLQEMTSKIAVTIRETGNEKMKIILDPWIIGDLITVNCWILLQTSRSKYSMYRNIEDLRLVIKIIKEGGTLSTTKI